MKQIVVIWFAVIGVVMAAEPAGYVRWPGAELKALSKKLGPKMNAQKLTTEQLRNFGNHSVMAVHREGDGESEVHQTQVDIFIVQSGEGTLVVGGQVVGGKTTAPNEIRGTSITGGQRSRLGPGDVVHIPAKTAHQVLVEPGKQFTYLIVKVDTP
jgi:mannose-6-phosphate isomerase-like protein (cupin superfamily)